MKKVAIRPKQFQLWFAAAIAASILLYCAVTFYFFGPMRHAKLGLIDDHEILRFIGTDHSIALTDIPGILLNQTEVGKWGTADRLRPAYYLFRIIESALWRDNAALWYLTRMAIIALTAFGMSLIVVRGLLSWTTNVPRAIVAWVISTIFGFLVLSFPSWLDIATRLGPSEIYVSAGITLFLIGVTELWRQPHRRLWWSLMFVGYIIIVGSKEDGMIFAVPLAVVYFSKFWSSRHMWQSAILGIISTIFTVYIALGLLLATRQTGADMYGNSRSISGFLLTLSHNAFLLSVVTFFLLTVCIESFCTRRSSPVVAPRGFRRFAELVRRFPLSFASATCIYVVVMEAFFYQNYYSSITDGGRYAFLTNFATAASFLLLLVVGIKIPLRNALRISLAAAAVALLSVSPLADNLAVAQTFRSVSLATAAHTVVVNSQIQSGVTDLTAHRNPIALLLVDQPLEYEPLMALPEYLAYYGNNNAVFVSVEIPKSQYAGKDPLLQVLVARMTSMESTGMLEDGWRILAASERDSSRFTVCFYFGATPEKLSQCNSSHQVG